jgi:predicted cupin superfamily sugar epimerase
VPNGPGATLAGCAVAPGFDFADFELADRKTLLEQFPEHNKVILDLT